MEIELHKKYVGGTGTVWKITCLHEHTARIAYAWAPRTGKRATFRLSDGLRAYGATAYFLPSERDLVREATEQEWKEAQQHWRRGPGELTEGQIRHIDKWFEKIGITSKVREGKPEETEHED